MPVVAAPAPRTRAPSFALSSTTGGSVDLDDLVAGGPALVVFCAEECPTSRLAVRRLAAVAAGLVDDGIAVACVFEDPLPVAARVARAAALEATVLSEPPPYATSTLRPGQRPHRRAGAGGRHGGRAVRRLGRRGLGRAAGPGRRDAAGVPARALPADEPRQKPGCGAKSTYDAATMALDAAGAAGLDEQEDLFERGWSDGLPVVPPTPERVTAMLGGRDPAESLGPVPPGMGEATLERVAACAVLAGCRPEYFPGGARRLPRRARGRLQPQRAGRHDLAARPAGSSSTARSARPSASNSGMGALGPRLARQPDHRPRPAAARDAHGRRQGRAGSTARRWGTPARSAPASPRRRRSAPGSRLSVERGFAEGASDRDAPRPQTRRCPFPTIASTTPEELARSASGWAAASPAGARTGGRSRRPRCLRGLPRARAPVRRGRLGARPTFARGWILRRRPQRPGPRAERASVRRRRRTRGRRPRRAASPSGRGPRTSC